MNAAFNTCNLDTEDWYRVRPCHCVLAVVFHSCTEVLGNPYGLDSCGEHEAPFRLLRGVLSAPSEYPENVCPILDLYWHLRSSDLLRNSTWDTILDAASIIRSGCLPPAAARMPNSPELSSLASMMRKSPRNRHTFYPVPPLASAFFQAGLTDQVSRQDRSRYGLALRS